MGKPPKQDADLYGPVEDAGYDPDTATPKVTRHVGVNRSQTFLNPMDQVSQVTNIKVDGGAMANYGNE